MVEMYVKIRDSFFVEVISEQLLSCEKKGIRTLLQKEFQPIADQFKRD
jgi:hypothetical protein